MRRWTVFWVVLAAASPGCGGDDEKAAVTAAKSAPECQELWNANAHGGSAGQKAPEDYLAEIAPTQAVVAFVNGECVVMAPVEPDGRRVYVWVARGGRAPYGHPSQDDLPPGRELRFNARATAEGKLE